MTKNTVEEIVRRLAEERVRYLIVGGLAAVAHGVLRFTSDMDLVLDMTEANLRRAVRVFSSLGYRPRAPVPLEQFCDRDTRLSWGEDKSLTVFSLWSEQHPMTEVDLFVESPFADFNGVYERALRLEIAPGVEAMFVGRGDLIHLKRQAGRPLDLSDIEKLQIVEEGDDKE